MSSLENLQEIWCSKKNDSCATISKVLLWNGVDFCGGFYYFDCTYMITVNWQEYVLIEFEPQVASGGTFKLNFCWCIMLCIKNLV